ncbi:MAG: cysteine--tRNA ligase [Clostridia bacterium]|nr:cysteine--tRNA ligase [Clostridia bacterium]
MLKLYNTLTREKSEFKPIDKNGKVVKIYTCGPTVYNYAHIGNMRAYIFMDVLRKVLKYNGYALDHVMNITDVGHLTSDADEGEDKMAKSAKEQHKSVYEIAKMYTEAFLKDIDELNIERPEHIVKATDHIKEMEEYVKEIVENGYGYETSKGIYFDTSKLPSYGELSKIDLKNQMSGARIEVDPEKRNPLDFALWIKAPKEHIMKWDSKWGLCYPGWHIECSAMSRKYLGEEFDIHTGGVDHIPIHHENEIAQSKGATGKNLARTWMHVEFLLINNGKMSKSLHNVYTLEDLKKNGIEPLAYRYLTYSSHYRNKLNFTWEGIRAAQVSLNRLRELTLQHKGVRCDIAKDKIEDLESRFLNAINDDINIPAALAVVWEVAKEPIKSDKYYMLLKKFDTVLSLKLDKEVKENENEEYPEEVMEILKQRKIARDNKNFEESDRLRDQLKEIGYLVIDSKEGQKLKKV